MRAAGKTSVAMNDLSEDDVGEDIYPAMAAYQNINNRHDSEWQHPTMGVTSKIPPLFDGKSSWFHYEELIDDWIDLTTLDDTKHGPALKNRLVGETAVYKTLLDRNILKTFPQGSTAAQFCQGRAERVLLAILSAFT